MGSTHAPRSHPHSGSRKLLLISVVLLTNIFTFLFSLTFQQSCPLNTSLPSTASEENVERIDDSDLPQEYIAFASVKPLPLGYNPNIGSDRIYPAVGDACARFPDELWKYMTYDVNGSCPDDEILAQKLLLQGCEPLPRRRCRAPAQAEYTEPHPFPMCEWTTPPDTSVVWTAYKCKDYDCLVNRAARQKQKEDCHDCFDLGGNERMRWNGKVSRQDSLYFAIDEVLATRKPGTIRIGLDIGGGAATFSVRMRERNITIVTTSMNFNAPFNNFAASRGVIPLYLSISQRLPFYDNTLDIVHSMHVLSNWIPTTLLHFFLFDVYRILRPGGIFWLDHFFCLGNQLDEVYGPLFESIGFVKLRWVTGKKFDQRAKRIEIYLSALLEKPLRNSW